MGARRAAKLIRERSMQKFASTLALTVANKGPPVMVTTSARLGLWMRTVGKNSAERRTKSEVMTRSGNEFNQCGGGTGRSPDRMTSGWTFFVPSCIARRDASRGREQIACRTLAPAHGLSELRAVSP